MSILLFFKIIVMTLTVSIIFIILFIKYTSVWIINVAFLRILNVLIIVTLVVTVIITICFNFHYHYWSLVLPLSLFPLFLLCLFCYYFKKYISDSNTIATLATVIFISIVTTTIVTVIIGTMIVILILITYLLLFSSIFSPLLTALSTWTYLLSNQYHPHHDHLINRCSNEHHYHHCNHCNNTIDVIL